MSTPAVVGIAGDRSATCGIAGLIPAQALPDLHPPATCGIAGLDTSGVAAAAPLTATGQLGVAGTNCRPVLEGATAALQPPPPTGSTRLGDRAAATAWQAARWFADYSYLVAWNPQTQTVRWRAGREAVFGPPHRKLPLLLDSAGYRRVLTGTAPRWTHQLASYAAAIELLHPAAYAAYDDPLDKAASLRHLETLCRLFPQDVGNGRLWPVYSVRWSFTPEAVATFERLPGWASRRLSPWMPLTKRQRQVPEATRERWGRLAIAQALVLANDPDFKAMCDLTGQVMLGGLVQGPIPRLARGLFAATLVRLFPGVRFWLLGQASGTVVSSLGWLGLLNDVSVDGTWWIRDATAGAMAYVENGLITTLRLGRGRDQAGNFQRDVFFTLKEMMAANLRSLLAAYVGELSWPPPTPLPVDPRDAAQMRDLRTRVQVAQLELGL